MIYHLQVRSTFTDRQGTKIFDKENLDYSKAVTGVAYSKDDAKDYNSSCRRQTWSCS